jgi:hypothetical protein
MPPRRIWIEDAEFAGRDRPQITIETDTIDALHKDIGAKASHVLRP